MKKQEQLGMNPSTASNRLVKDLLYNFAVEAGNKCFHCNGDLTRETFSIEHKSPWLDSEDPVGLYFDISNIAYSHQSCNSGARRKDSAMCGTLTSYKNGCRCSPCRTSMSESNKKYYTTERRRERYSRNKEYTKVS